MTMTAPIDLSRLSQITPVEQEQNTLLALFFRAGWDLISAMEKSLHAGDAAGWDMAARSLQGAASNLGIYPLANVCGQALQEGALTGSESATLLDWIQIELENVRIYLARQHPTLLIQHAA